MRSITVSTCNLNQWSLDFVGNKSRIIAAVAQAKEHESRLIITPELSLSGYDCLDAFLEQDTTTHSWQVLAELIVHPICQDIIIDVGLPICHFGVLYNARLVFYNNKILYIRCKMSLANDGLFREMRYFTPWPQSRGIEEFMLPKTLRDVTNQRHVPIGNLVLEALDCTIGIECCEELFTPNNTSIHLGLQGVDVICNSSASHWQLRKLDRRLDLIREASRKGGLCYMYSNQQGCEGGGRMYYDGCALVCLNGDIKAQASQFSLNEVEVVSATVDLDELWQARYPPSRRMQASAEPAYRSVKLDECLTVSDAARVMSRSREPFTVRPEEEIALGAGAWLWDYLRRAKQAGFFLPLSGGIDSCATAVIVFSAARLVCDAVAAGNKQVLKDIRMIAGEDSNWTPRKPQDVCRKIFHTCFMGTTNSSKETRERARQLAEDIGSYHLDIDIDPIFSALKQVDAHTFNRELHYESRGGSKQESLALQNLQSRSRMVLAYHFASTITLARKRTGGGALLVLGSANVDECLRGYLTKYDNSSADINPIGSISKTDLKRLIRYAQSAFDLRILQEFLDAVPTAELLPIDAKGVSQSDEVDMGCTYEELGDFGRLRKIDKLGPYSMWLRLRSDWADKKTPEGNTMTPRDVYKKVRHLWWYFGINRHKQEVLTPALHAETYSPDSNRYDLQPFLRPQLSLQWQQIEKELDAMER